MNKPIIAITYNAKKGGTTVAYLAKCLKDSGCSIQYIDYEAMTEAINEEKFRQLYSSTKGRARILAHAKFEAKAQLGGIDCLALPGNSSMIDPKLFGNSRSYRIEAYSLRRTIAELALVHIAIQKGMPVYGVCGGHQLVAVYSGGKLADLNQSQESHHKFCKYNTITTEANSVLGKTNGILQVFGAHNQFVSQPGANLKVTAKGSDGAVIEALESIQGAPILTTQFHPEVAYSNPSLRSHLEASQQEQTVAQAKNIFTYIHDVAKTYQIKRESLKKLKNKDHDQDQFSDNKPKKSGFMSFISACWLAFVRFIISLFSYPETPQQTMLNTPGQRYT